MASALQQLVYNLSAKLCCFYSGKDCICIFRIYTEKYFWHYFSSFLFLLFTDTGRFWLKPRGLRLPACLDVNTNKLLFTCKTYSHYCLSALSAISRCIYFSYKPHSLPPVIIFLTAWPASGLTHLIFSYMAKLSLSLAIAFDADNNLSVSFFFFFSTFHSSFFLFNIPNFYFFRIFLRISAQKNSIHYWML